MSDEEEQINFPQEYWILAADLSLKRPGFCKMKIKNKKIEAVQLSSINNKTKKKARGQLLSEIYDFFKDWMPSDGIPSYYIRQKSINNMNAKFQRSGSLAISGISEVVGIVDYLLWKHEGKEWYELYPVSIKKIMTGNGRAEKEEVAASLSQYIGQQQYRFDDESDAAAVGLAWLISHDQIQKQGD